MSSLDPQHLPIELIADILSRLTLEDVMRYRYVSKSWFALINDSYFKEIKHLESIESPNLSLLISRIDGLYKGDLNDALPEDKMLMLHSCFLCNPRILFTPSSVVVGSCDGLVCLFDGYTCIAIWNPSIMEINMIPPMPVEFGALHLKKNYVISYGFGHDRISGDYKVLAITISGVGFKVRVYSLKKKSWAKKSWRFPNIIIRSKEVGTFARRRNAIHWIMERKGVDWNNRHKVVVAFDIGVGNGYHEVLQPDYEIKPYWLALGALRGCLCIHSIYLNFSSDLWVMNKEESWTRLISFVDPLPNWPLPGYVKPIAYSRGGDKVLLYDCAEKKLIWYDLKTNTVTIVTLWRNLSMTGVCLHRNIKYDKRREGRRNLFSSVFKIFQCGK